MAAPLGGPRGSVGSATRSRWWCRGDPAPGRGEGQEGGVPLPGPLPRPPPWAGARGPGSDWRKAPGARRAASSSGAVQARAPGGGDPLAVPCGRRTARVARTGVDHAGGGPWSRARTAPGGLGQAGRPVAFPRALRSQAEAPPLRSAAPRPRPCWPDRRTRGALQGGPLPAPGGPDPQGHVLGRRPCPAPTAMRVRASPAPGGRGRTIGADCARGGSPGRRPPGGRRCHSMTAPAHRVGDLRDRPPAPGPAPMVDPPVWWRISRAVIPPAYRPMIIESNPPRPPPAHGATGRGVKRAGPVPGHH